MGGAVREVAAAYVVLGQAAAYFALYAIALNPATFHALQLEIFKDSDQHPPEQGQADCGATAAETLQMRADALVLLLFAVAQAVAAMAAVAATSRLGNLCAMILSIPMALRLLDVVPGVVDLTIGRCHGSYHQVLNAGCAIVYVIFTLLFAAGLGSLCYSGKDTGNASSRCACGKAPVPVATESRETNGPANAPRQGAVSRVRTVPKGTALAAAVTKGKPAPSSSGHAASGSPSPKQGKIKHGAASTSQAPPPRPLAAPGNLGSRPQLAHTAAAPLQYRPPPSLAWTQQQQQHLQYQHSLPQLQCQQPLALPQPQQDVHGGHGVRHTALMGILPDMSLSLQDSRRHQLLQLTLDVND